MIYFDHCAALRAASRCYAFMTMVCVVGTGFLLPHLVVLDPVEVVVAVLLIAQGCAVASLIFWGVANWLFSTNEGLL